MHDRVEPLERGGIAEDDRPELLAIDGAIVRENSLAERGDHIRIGGTVRRVNRMTDFVGVDYRRAQFREHRGDGTFARTDSAHQANRQHHIALPYR